MPGRAWLAAAVAALCAGLLVPLAGAFGTQADAAQAQAQASHVVVVGISGLTWSEVTDRKSVV